MPSSVSAHRLSGSRVTSAPHGVVEPAGHVRAERVLAGVAARAVPAVVAERDRLGECDVEAEGLSDRRGHLGDLEGVREPGALVVVGEDEHLRLAGQPAERARVQDAVAIALEAGAPRIGSSSSTARSPAPTARVASTASCSASRSSRATRSKMPRRAAAGPGVGVRKPHVVPGCGRPWWTPSVRPARPDPGRSRVGSRTEGVSLRARVPGGSGRAGSGEPRGRAEAPSR
jgi:hypothetical protein